MILGDLDKAALDAMAAKDPRAFGAILAHLAWIAVGREEAATTPADKDRWALAHLIAANAAARAREVGL